MAPELVEEPIGGPVAEPTIGLVEAEASITGGGSEAIVEEITGVIDLTLGYDPPADVSVKPSVAHVERPPCVHVDASGQRGHGGRKSIGRGSGRSGRMSASLALRRGGRN